MNLLAFFQYLLEDHLKFGFNLVILKICVVFAIHLWIRSPISDLPIFHCFPSNPCGVCYHLWNSSPILDLLISHCSMFLVIQALLFVYESCFPIFSIIYCFVIANLCYFRLDCLDKIPLFIKFDNNYYFNLSY